MAQSTRPPRDLNKLATRAAEFWRLSAMGQRAKAVEFVLLSDRDRYLNSNAIPFIEPEVAGIAFTDEERKAIVQVVGTSIVPNAQSQMKARVEDVWVWANNNWFLDLPDEEHPFRLLAGVASRAQEESLAEVENAFKLVDNVLKVGTIWDNDLPILAVPIEYTGQIPIRILGPETDSLVILDKDTTEYVPPGSKSFRIRLLPENHDGPFRFPLPLTVQYRDVSIKKTLIVEGTVFAPLTFRQVPEIVAPPDWKKGFELFVRNNTDKPVVIQQVITDGLKVQGGGLVEGNSELRLGLMMLEGLPDFISEIVIITADPINGKSEFRIKVRKSTA